MTKTIIKEIGIVALLIVAIGLLLAIILYDYIPNRKAVPIKIQDYEMPADIKEEIENTSLDEQNIVRTYYIDSSDLDLYESTNNYDKGKANPFADYSEESDEGTNSTSNNTTNSTSSNTKNNQSSSNTSKSTENSSSEVGSNTKNEVYMNTPGKNS